MNIEEMSEQEKSIALAELCGWLITLDAHGKKWIRHPNEVFSCTNLYHPAFMFLAWRVISFADDEYTNGNDWIDGFFTWWNDAELYRFLPAVAQSAWLDKILSLAIKAEMIAND